MSSGLGQKQYTEEECDLLELIEQEWKPVPQRDPNTGRRPLPEQYQRTPTPPTFKLEVRGPEMGVIRHIASVNEVEAEVHGALQRACGDFECDLFIHENVANPYHWTNEEEIVERIRTRSVLVHDDGEPDMLVLAMVPKTDEEIEREMAMGKDEEEEEGDGAKKGLRKMMKGLVRKRKKKEALPSSET